MKREIFDIGIGDFPLHFPRSDGRSQRRTAIHQSQFDVPSEIREALLWLIDHGDDRVAQWAVKALGNAGGGSAIDKLAEISKSPDYSTTIRREAGGILNNNN
ncbi:HEAT repeat domain-containing protein [Halosimplex pelagicum]|uniref:HEAT repeat domain-containing protein n=1 Tax=Halosimplex pelagicum TaxID=869886 RepID=A0A7D5SWE0_9EURY|nr:HEAT repeat domain-containing protein [Halosimplex pelagicum]QLH83027.1 HEAT repeat domain-containing protein [Halosimplex pelagicum]